MPAASAAGSVMLLVAKDGNGVSTSDMTPFACAVAGVCSRFQTLRCVGIVIGSSSRTAAAHQSVGKIPRGRCFFKNSRSASTIRIIALPPKIARKLQTLQEVGLGYIQLGQAATTLSGGEAQRVKLANELARRDTGQTVYILDEPTTGLHVADVHRLVKVLDKLVDAGNTVIVIEHNLDVIKRADYIIDLGPEGGSGGGTIVATGTPEEVAQNPHSFTGQYLRPVLERAAELQSQK